MAWIEAHQSLKDHPKVGMLADLMEWDDPDIAIAKLFRFWWWCVDYAPDGDLQSRGFNDSQLARAAGLSGSDGSRFKKAMVAARWLDTTPYFRVHDWWDYAGKYLQSKFKDHPDKWKEIQRKYSCATDGVTDGVARETYIHTNKQTNKPTGDVSEKPEKTATESPGFTAFRAAWPKHHRAAGTWKEVERHWTAKKLEPQAAEILAGLERWKRSAEWEKDDGAFIPAPKVWLNKQRWLAHPPASVAAEDDWRTPVTQDTIDCFLGRPIGGT